MQLWKKLTEIYINERGEKEIISTLESLRDELKGKNLAEKEKKLSEIIEKVKNSNNANKVLEKQIWAEHFFYLTGTHLTK